MPEHVDCLVCGGSSFKTILNQADSIYFERNIVKCADCGLVFVCPQPTDAELDELYNVELSETGRKMMWNVVKKQYEIRGFEKQNSRSHEFSESELQIDSSDPAFIRWRRRVNLIAKKFPGGRTVLDIGCNAGEFLFFAKKAGMDGMGIELSSLYAEIARKRTGFDVFNGTLSSFSAERSERKFDIVALWDVIEHLKNPAEDLNQINGLMNSGGVLCVSTVNLRCYRYLMHKEDWRGFYEGHEHISFFSPVTLSRLLEQCGFRPVVIRTYNISPVLLRWLNVFRMGNTLEVYAVKK